MNDAELKAGRELDALVAERVFGAQGRRIAYAHRDRKKRENPMIVFDAPKVYGDAVGTDFGTYTFEDNTTASKIGFAREYSMDIEAAWAVVENMVARGRAFSPIVQFAHYDGYWRVAFSVSQMWDESAKDPSFPLCVCLAALKAVSAPASEGGR